MYTVDDYLWMLADDRRVRAYAEAILAVVKPGDRVIEIGAGLAFFSVLAARAGAARVDALDLNPVVHLGRRVAESNGVGERIHVHQIDSERFTPAAPADVVIADLRGPTPLAGRSLMTMIDARRRLLRPGGAVIAARDTMRFAPARAPAVFCREIAAPLKRPEVCFEPVSRIAFDTPFRCPIHPDELLGPAVSWHHIDYRSLEYPDCRGEGSWTFDRTASVEGLAVWFDAELAPGVALSAAPSEERRVYAQVFVPFRQPVVVAAAERLRAEIETRFVQDGYVWRWQAWTAAPGGRERLAVSQNSIAERVLDSSALANARYNPSL